MSRNNTETLLIRACKSENPKKRLMSVYKRRYCSPLNKDECVSNIILILCPLVESLGNFHIHDIIVSISPNNMKHLLFSNGDVYNYNNEVLEYLISKIRHTEVKDLGEDFRVPRRFRIQT